MSSHYEKVLRKVEAAIASRNLIINGDKVLVALSGGADSVFLLYILSQLGEKYGFSLSAAHLNHQLRDVANDEEAFSRDLCEGLKIPFFSKRADISHIARTADISFETAGRLVRYSFFEDLKREHNFTKIATAHHLNDNAETIIMHFIRGCGASGMGGIEYLRPDGIIRPLLDISKQEIYDCCEELGIEYVTDLSNFEPVYSRNRIRLDLIPKLEEYNPNIVRTICSNAELFSEDDEFLNNCAREIFEKNFKDGLPKSVLDAQGMPIRRRLVQLLYAKATHSAQNLSKQYTTAVLSMTKTGQSVCLPQNISATLSYGIISMKPINSKPMPFEYPIKIGEELYIPEAEEYWLIKESPECEKNTFLLPEKSTLLVRSRRVGDKFFPVGMDGKKSLSNLFTDRKIPPDKRDKIPVLTADNEIVNIGGCDRDRRFYNNDKNSVQYQLVRKKATPVGIEIK